MRFCLHLRPQKSRPQLMWNYHYPLAAWLYGVIAKADAEYATFLHQKGYEAPNGKHFKHFTFSDLRFKMGKQNANGFEVASPTILWTVSFLIDHTAESFIIGLFQDQHIQLFNQTFDNTFIIERIETLPAPHFDTTTKLLATSAMVVAEKRKGLDQYLDPTDPLFGKYLIDGLIDKYLSVLQERGETISPEVQEQTIKFELMNTEKMKSRKVTIKEGKAAATEVKGYRNFAFELTAPPEIIEVGYYGGYGKHSAEGFGYCEVLG
jgi:CRISPR-associated endoribonuclease Cas6